MIDKHKRLLSIGDKVRIFGRETKIDDIRFVRYETKIEEVALCVVGNKKVFCRTNEIELDATSPTVGRSSKR